MESANVSQAGRGRNAISDMRNARLVLFHHDICGSKTSEMNRVNVRLGECLMGLYKNGGELVSSREEQ